jgi:hypothetical protein
MTQDIDKLVAELQAIATYHAGPLGPEDRTEWKAADALATIAKRLEEAEAAIRPFADVADTEDEVGRDDPDDDRVFIVQAYGCQLADMTSEHFRAARRWLEG